MRIALGSDEETAFTGALDVSLTQAGHDILRFGALADRDDTWPVVGREVGEAVASGRADFGIVCCWTGTGVSIAANKVPGVRAALCGDAQTAAGARKWNDANVLALSLRATALPVALEIVEAWLSTSVSEDPLDRAAIAGVEAMRLQDV